MPYSVHEAPSLSLSLEAGLMTSPSPQGKMEQIVLHSFHPLRTFGHWPVWRDASETVQPQYAYT